MAKKLKQEDVLKYSPGRKSQKTVRRHFIEWRLQQNPPIPLRCDNFACQYHNEPLFWNGTELNVILDHINGVNGANSTKNLQFLCPNCNSQQHTQGGGNKGRTEQHSGGFSTKDIEGKKHYVMPLESGKFEYTGSDINLEHKKT
jgi:5-methylcytosine-specific restriction endonuclease McrA